MRKLFVLLTVISISFCKSYSQSIPDSLLPIVNTFLLEGIQCKEYLGNCDSTVETQDLLLKQKDDILTQTELQNRDLKNQVAFTKDAYSVEKHKNGEMENYISDQHKKNQKTKRWNTFWKTTTFIELLFILGLSI